MEIARLIGGIPAVTAVAGDSHRGYRRGRRPLVLDLPGCGHRSARVRVGVASHGIQRTRLREGEVPGQFSRDGNGASRAAPALLVPPIMKCTGFPRPAPHGTVLHVKRAEHTCDTTETLQPSCSIRTCAAGCPRHRTFDRFLVRSIRRGQCSKQCAAHHASSARRHDPCKHGPCWENSRRERRQNTSIPVRRISPMRSHSRAGSPRIAPTPRTSCSSSGIDGTLPSGTAPA